MDRTTHGPENPQMLSDFLKQDYSLKVQYLSDQFTRMWNRFQFLLGLETVVGGLYFAPLGEARALSSAAFAALGIVISLFWYVVGAEDRFLVGIYRQQVKEAGERAATNAGLEGYTYAGDVNPANLRCRRFAVFGISLVIAYESFVQWRIDSLSTTHLAAIFPLLVLGFWVILLLLRVT